MLPAGMKRPGFTAKLTLSSQSAFPGAQITLSISPEQFSGLAEAAARKSSLPPGDSSSCHHWGVYTGTDHLAQKEPDKGDRNSHLDTPVCTAALAITEGIDEAWAGQP